MTPLPYRVAAYYAPEADDPLHIAGSAWLGRDAGTQQAIAQPDLPDIAAVTAEARRYGLHATLKPPMRLRPTRMDGVIAAAERIAARIAPFPLPPLAVTQWNGFLCLMEQGRSPALQDFADACVRDLDAFRAPPDEAERARRQRARLTPIQHAMLERWGYPDVFESWRFHITLSRRLDAGERAILLPAAEAHFAAALAVPRRVESLALFVEPEPGTPFHIAARLALRG